MELNTIFFIGPQGCGKGTQAKILAEKLKFFHWEMGGILRQVGKEDSELGKRVKNLIDQGILLNDEQLYEVLDSRLAQIPKDRGIIFDGVPRRIRQAEYLFNYLKSQGRTNFLTLYISLPEEESIKRLLLRAEKEKRADDTLEKIKFRLEQYYKDTLPVIDFLKEKTVFFEINGEPSIEKVAKNIWGSLKIT